MGLEAPDKSRKIREASQHFELESYKYLDQNSKYSSLRKIRKGKHRTGNI